MEGEEYWGESWRVKHVRGRVRDGAVDVVEVVVVVDDVVVEHSSQTLGSGGSDGVLSSRSSPSPPLPPWGIKSTLLILFPIPIPIPLLSYHLHEGPPAVALAVAPKDGRGEDVSRIEDTFPSSSITNIVIVFAHQRPLRRQR